MNKNVVFILLGAFFIAMIVAMIIRSAFSSSSNGDTNVEVSKILVANKSISIGRTLTKDDVRWQTWPKDALFKGVIKESDQKDPDKLAIYGQKIRRSIEKGEPISLRAIIKESEGHSFIASSLGAGMRAVSIPVSAASSAGGFIRPGDRVDVILTYSPRFSGEAKNYSQRTVQRYASQTVLSNVKVLAIDQKSTKSKSDDEKAKPGKTITLEVSKKDAEVIYLSLEMGEMSLALRGLGEKDGVKLSKTKNLTTDANVSDVIKSVTRKQRKASVNTNSIRVYNGRNAQDVIVRAAEQ